MRSWFIQDADYRIRQLKDENLRLETRLAEAIADLIAERQAAQKTIDGLQRAVDDLWSHNKGLEHLMRISQKQVDHVNAKCVQKARDADIATNTIFFFASMFLVATWLAAYAR